MPSLSEQRNAVSAAPLTYPWGRGAVAFGRAQAFLAARGGRVSDVLIGAAVAESTVAGRAPAGAMPLVAEAVEKPRERVAVLDGLRRLQVTDWRSLHDDDRPARAVRGDREIEATLQHLADLPNVLALFRIPVPAASGLAGVRSAPRREVALRSPSDQNGLLVGDNYYRGRAVPATLSLDDLRRHLYICGQTGVGKSTLLMNLAAQSMQAGLGMAIIDPHGDLVEQVAARVPATRRDDIVYFNPSDPEWAVSYNFMECPPSARAFVVENFLGTLYELFDPGRSGIVGPRFEHGVRNAMHLAMAAPGGATLVDVVRVLTEPAFAAELLDFLQDPMVRSYWLEQIPRTSDFHRSEVLDYIVSKFSRFTHDPRIRRVIGLPRSAFSLRQLMDDGKILLVNLAQGPLGEEASRFLGLTLVSQLAQATFARGDAPTAMRRDFVMFVDEFQSFAGPSFSTLLSGARKYGVSLVLAHQHVHQLPRSLADAVFGNVGSLVSFRVGVQDAALLASAMRPSVFGAEDLLTLPNFHAIATLLDRGERTPAFNVTAHAEPAPVGGLTWGGEVLDQARARYGRPVAEVDQLVEQRFRDRGEM